MPGHITRPQRWFQAAPLSTADRAPVRAHLGLDKPVLTTLAADRSRWGATRFITNRPSKIQLPLEHQPTPRLR